MIIDPGDGGGEPLVFRSDEGKIAASFSEAQVNQFYRESDGSMGFRIDAGSCPESFSAPHGHLFNGFVPNTSFLSLSSETTTVTAQWRLDTVEAYGPIAIRVSDPYDAERVYFARVSDGPIFFMGCVEWQVIGAAENKDGPAWLAISTDVLEFNEPGDPRPVAVRARRYCRSLKEELFSDAECYAIGSTEKEDGGGAHDYQISADIPWDEPLKVLAAACVSGPEVFPLSAAETAYYLPVTGSEDDWDWSFENRLPGGWWCRSAESDDGTLTPAFVDSEGMISNSQDHYYDAGVTGVRPAFQLDLAAVLFLSAAEGGKSSATELGQMAAWRAFSTATIEKENGTVEVPAYKLTLRDWEHGGLSASTDMTTVAAGGALSITYSGAKTGDNEYVSAMLCDGEGNPLYYGHVAHDSASGAASLSIPADVPAGSYTLKIFAEQANGDRQTDYAGSFNNIALTVTDVPADYPPEPPAPEPEPEPEPEPAPEPAPEPQPEPAPAYVVPKSGDVTQYTAIAVLGLLGVAFIIWSTVSDGGSIPQMRN